MPSGTYICQEEKSAPGFKAAKDRFAQLLGGNTEGDYKLKPVVVYHSANPCALNSYIKHLLPMHFFQVPRGRQQSYCLLTT
jgi:hypothetical protein